MVLSYYMFKPFYSLIWNVMKYLNKTLPVVFYCGDPLDYYVFQPVQRYLCDIPVVTDKLKTYRFLRKQGLKARFGISFPDTVIMSRHATHKFPSDSIYKIGMRHGAYHFKQFSSQDNYNKFDLYFVTSEADAEAARRRGISNIVSAGFPKLDSYVQTERNSVNPYELKQKLGLENRPTLLFFATYDKSGMSAVQLWYDKLECLTKRWNVLVTLHPRISAKYRNMILTTRSVRFLNEYQILPYILISDVCIGDTSSLIAECCALNKPLITWRTAKAKRSVTEIDAILKGISIRISDFSELAPAIEKSLAHPDAKDSQRQKANRIFFDNLDGKAGERMANWLVNLIPALSFRKA